MVISTIRVRLHFNLVNKCIPLILLSVLCQYFMFFIYCMCMLDHLKHKNIRKTQCSMRNVMAFPNQNKMSCICQCRSFTLSYEHDSLLHKHSFFFLFFFFSVRKLLKDLPHAIFSTLYVPLLINNLIKVALKPQFLLNCNHFSLWNSMAV